MLQFEIIHDLETLLANTNTWDRLAQDHPLLRASWMLGWIEHKIEHVTPSVIVGRNPQGEWVGIAPFCVDDQKAGMLRKLRMIGSGHACTDYVQLMCQPQFAERFSIELADWMTLQLRPGGQLGSIDVVELEGFCREHEPTNLFFEMLNANGLKSFELPIEGCWEVPLESSWESQNATLSKSLRRKTKKARQRLADSHSEIRSTDDHEFETLWPVFVELHQQRRQMLGQPGCFSDKNFHDWLYLATLDLISRGQAELTIILHEGKPLAACLVFNNGRQAWMYQTGFAPEQVKLEPGYQIAVHALGVAIKKGFKSFDFMRGDEPYKRRWNSRRVELTRTRLIPNRVAARIKNGIWMTGRTFRDRWWARETVD